MHVLTANRYFLLKLLCLGAIASVLVYYNSWAVGVARAEQEARAQAEQQAAGLLPNDGIFTGSAQGRDGAITVSVVVERGLITDIDIVDAPQGEWPYVDAARVVVDEIIETQSTDVDTVSGAKSTSAGIINATRQALLDSVGDGA